MPRFKVFSIQTDFDRPAFKFLTAPQICASLKTLASISFASTADSKCLLMGCTTNRCPTENCEHGKFKWKRSAGQIQLLTDMTICQIGHVDVAGIADLTIYEHAGKARWAPGESACMADLSDKCNAGTSKIAYPRKWFRTKFS